jgi:hypothetical protein
VPHICEAVALLVASTEAAARDAAEHVVMTR